jgi:hypothetical protein
MIPLPLFVVIALGVLLLVFLVVLLPVLQQAVPLIQSRLEGAGAALAGRARAAFRWAGHFLTEAGRFSPSEALSQVVGAVLMLGAATIIILCELQFTWATIGPLLGFPFDPNRNALAAFDWLLSMSSLVLAIVFGVMGTDLLGWTRLSRWHGIERGRVGAFCLAGLGVGTALSVAVALAAQRVLTLFENDPALEQVIATWGQLLSAFILVGLSALLFMGLALALVSLETVCSALVAGLIASWGVALGMVTLVVRAAACLAEVTQVGVTALSLAPLRNAIQGGGHRVGTTLASRSRAIVAWLEECVGGPGGRRDEEAAAKATSRTSPA